MPETERSIRRNEIVILESNNMRTIGMILMLIGFLTAAFADNTQNSLEGQNYTDAFWKVYTDALRGDKVAQFQVGVMFERGLGINKNEAEAAGWYEKSGKQGYVDAQYNIGIMYASGRGVLQNDGMAMMWLALAAKQGDGESRKLLLALIDEKASTAKGPDRSSDNSGTELKPITPVTLICKENSIVCSRYNGEGECTPFKQKTVVTSKEKQGHYYKISGIVTKHQWKEYTKEGWIEESSVEVRR